MKEMTIIIIGIISTIIIVILFYFVYINRESDKTISLALKILIPLIGAVLWIMLEFFSSNIERTDKTQLTLLNNKNTGQIIDFDNYILEKTNDVSKQSEYKKIYEIWTRNEKEILQKGKLNQLDLIEAGFWNWYASKYRVHWEFDREEFVGFGKKIGISKPSNDAENEIFKLDLKEKIIEINSSFNNISNTIALPNDCIVSRNKLNGVSTEIILVTKELEMKIVFKYFTAVALGNDDLSNKMKAYLKTPEDWRVNFNTVTFTVKKNRIYQWSPRTRKLETWSNNIIKDFIRDFNKEDYMSYLESQL